jgi:maltose/moltooligosaccharide transporter
MTIPKLKLSFSQIINMNVGFFGIQYSFGLQQSAVNPIYDFLGASPDQIPLLNLAGPMTGLLIQPIIGALSDKTYLPKWGGRRKPFFLIGAIMCSICLFLFPFSSSLWMAVGLLWILDAGNNTAMEPYRAFVADKLNNEQQGKGFLAQSFFTGFGQTLANLSLFIFPLLIIGKTGSIPNWVFASFFLGSVCSIGSVWWSMKTTPEHPLSEDELAEIRKEPLSLFSPFTDVVKAIKNMPKVMWMLALVYMFQWYALFCYWQNSSKAIALNAYNWTIPTHEHDAVKGEYANFEKELKNYTKANNVSFEDIKKRDTTYAMIYHNNKAMLGDKITISDNSLQQLQDIQTNDKRYENAVSWTGLVNGWYNIVTFLVAFSLVGFAKRYGAKWVHATCLLLTGLGFIFFSFCTTKISFLFAITGFGIGWASMMGVPYMMVVSKIPKEKYGVYMGIINMMIVIPMLIQTVTFGYIMKNILHNNSSYAILFAGVLVLIAAVLTLFIPNNKDEMALES